MRPFLPSLAVLWIAALPLLARPRLHVANTQPGSDFSVELILDQQAVEAARVGKPTKSEWLEVSPPWPGHTVWKDTGVLEFQPTAAPVLGTTYSFTLIGEHRYRDGKAIPQGSVGGFITPAFRVERAMMLNRYSEAWSPRTGSWFVSFNAEVAPDRAAFSFRDKANRRIPAKVEQAHLGRLDQWSRQLAPTHAEAWAAYLHPGTLPPVDASKLPDDHILPNALIITPAEPLPIGEDWALHIADTFHPRDSSAPYAGSVHHIGRIAPLQLKEVNAVTVADEPRTIVARFTLSLPKEVPADVVSVFPEIPGLKLTTEANTLVLHGDFSETDKWKVQFHPNLSSLDGRSLKPTGKSTEVHEVEFTHLDPGIALPGEDEAQLSAGSRRYHVETVNTPQVHVRVKRLTGDQLIRTFQGYRHYTGRGHNYADLSPTYPIPWEMIAGDKVADFEILLDNPIDTSREIVLDWDQVLDGKNIPYTVGTRPGPPATSPGDPRPATLFLEITGTPSEEIEDAKTPLAQAIVQLTDIGLAWKITPDHAFLYAYSCLTGQPLSGVTLETFGEDAALMNSAVSDASGIARLPRSDDARHLRASLGADSFVTAFDSGLEEVGLWRFPIHFSWNPPALVSRQVMLFTDRPLYRPGETVHLKGILRVLNGNRVENQESSPPTLTVKNPADLEVLSKTIELSDKGDFALDFELPTETTGSYEIQLSWPGELEAAEEMEDWSEKEQAKANALFTLPLRVEEFRRNAFEILTAPEPAEPGASSASINLEAHYYHGHPMKEARGTLWTRVTPKNFYPDRYRDYYFGDYRVYDADYWRHYFGFHWADDGYEEKKTVSESRDFTLDSAGRTTLTAPLPQSDFPHLQEVRFEASVTDENKQTLRKSEHVTVHPSSLWIGVERPDQLVRVGSAANLDVIAVGIDGLPVDSEVPVEVEMTREVNDQVRVQSPQGGSAVRNDTRTEPVLTSRLTLKRGKPGKLTFTPEHSGLHTIILRGKDAASRPFATAFTIQVYGSDEYPWAYTDDMRIKLVPEKTIYRPGETARVLVLSPIEGTALVTVEREDISRSSLVKLDLKHPVLEIPLTDEEAPNCYISVLVIKGARDSARMYKQPQLRLGYCELKVENVRERLAVEATAKSLQPDAETVPASFLPREELEIVGQVRRADGAAATDAVVTVWAEDEGTLAVLGFDTPDPLAWFYQPRFLRVTSGTSLVNFIAENPDEQYFHNKGIFIGGGGDLSSLPDFTRSDFTPCAFWHASVKTDAAGKFRVTATLPDTLTRYRLMAVAHDGADHFGNFESSFEVKQPLILEPQTPRFALEGDLWQMQTAVRNTSDIGGTWQVTLTTNPPASEPLAVIAAETDTPPQITASTNIELQPGQSGVVSFPVAFRNTGEAVVKWEAIPVSLNVPQPNPALRRRHSDSVENRFMVDYPMPLLRQVRLLRLEPGTADLDLLDGLDPALLNGRGELSIEASRSLLLEAGSAFDFLLRYPYGCAEQLSSSLLPWLAAEQLRPISPQISRHSPQEIRAVIRKSVARLLAMQRSDGGFGYWSDAKNSTRWSSSYVGLTLLLASGQAAVPPSSMSLLAEYLLRQQKDHSGVDASTRARELLFLSLVGQPQPAAINQLLDHPEVLDSRALSFLAMALAKGEEPEAARSVMEMTPGRENQSWMDDQSAPALRMLAWNTINPGGPEATLALDKMLGDRNPYGHWGTTWNNGWAMIALAQYSTTQEANRSTTTVTFTGTPGHEGSALLSPESPGSTKVLPLTRGMKLAASSDGFALIRLSLAAKPEIAPLKPIAANGMEIVRTYQRVNADGTTTPLDVPHPGDLIRINLHVTLAKDDLRYLIIEDRLPSLLEPINEAFQSQAAQSSAGGDSQSAWDISHTEIRGDRVSFFFDRINSRGNRTLSYLARCTGEGRSIAPPAKIESMYDPSNVALSASRLFHSVKEGNE